MNEGRIVLPQPAAGHWERACEVLHQIWQGTETEVWIGGETLLAARWHHRESVDLEFKFSPWARMREHSRHTPKGRRLDRAMAQAGYFRKKEDPLRITFEHETGTRIDLNEWGPIPKEGRDRVEAPGWGTIEALDNVEILARKVRNRLWGRTVRDLFDFAVAARVEPRTWELALNCAWDGAMESSVESAVRGWGRSRDHYRARAAVELSGVVPRYRTLTHECWAHAAVAVVQAVWTELLVRHTPDGAVVEGRKGKKVRWREEPTWQAKALRQHLLDLGARVGTGPGMVEYLEELMRKGRRGRGENLQVKSCKVRLDVADPILAEAKRMFDRDRREYPPGYGFARKLAGKDWPRYGFAQDEKGLTLETQFAEDTPWQTAGTGLTLEEMVRLEREMRRWPPEAEGAIRAQALREIGRNGRHGAT